MKKSTEKLEPPGGIEFPELKGLPDLESKFVRECVAAKEKGAGMAFAALLREKVFYIRETQEFYYFETLDSATNHGVWRLDYGGLKAESAVDLVKTVYLQEVARITNELKGIDPESKKATWLQAQKKALNKAAGNLDIERGLRSTLKFARAELAISADQLDSNPNLLVCQNVTLELDKAAHARPGRPEDYCTKVCNVEWHGLDCVDDLLERVSLEILSGNQAVDSYFWRWNGRALIGDSVNHEFLLLIGAGRNGKSLALNVIAYTVGDYAGAMPADLLIEQRFSRDANAPSPTILSLKGLRLALFSETAENQKIATTTVKLLTGGDTLTGRGVQGKSLVQFQPSHSMVLCTNNLPKAPASDYAFWQRVRLIEYKNRYVTGTPNPALGELPADLTLPEKLKKCGPAILAKLVRGCLEALRDGLNPPVEVTAAVAGYQRQEDLVRQWLDDRAEFGEGEEFFIQARPGHKNFKEWFFEEISEKFAPPGPKKYATEMARLLQKDTDSSNNNIYRGARIKIY